MVKSRQYKPGEVIPANGIYRVEHQSHRLMHEATLLRNSLFPSCRECHAAVRFQLVRAVHGRHLLPFRSSAILEEFERRKPPIDMAS